MSCLRFPITSSSFTAFSLLESISKDNAQRHQLNAEFVGGLYFLITVTFIAFCVLTGSILAYFFPFPLSWIPSSSKVVARQQQEAEEQQNDEKMKKSSSSSSSSSPFFFSNLLSKLAFIQNNVILYSCTLNFALFIICFLGGGLFGLLMGTLFLLVLLLLCGGYVIFKKYCSSQSTNFQELQKDFSDRNRIIKQQQANENENEDEQSYDKNDHDLKKENSIDRKDERESETINSGENENDMRTRTRKEGAEDRHQTRNLRSSSTTTTPYSSSSKTTKISWRCYPQGYSTPHAKIIVSCSVLIFSCLLLIAIIAGAWPIGDYKVLAMTTSSSSSPRFSIEDDSADDSSSSSWKLKNAQMLYRFPTFLTKIIRPSSTWFSIVGSKQTSCEDATYQPDVNMNNNINHNNNVDCSSSQSSSTTGKISSLLVSPGQSRLRAMNLVSSSSSSLREETSTTTSIEIQEYIKNQDLLFKIAKCVLEEERLNRILSNSFVGNFTSSLSSSSSSMTVLINRFAESDSKLLYSPIEGKIVHVFDLNFDKKQNKFSFSSSSSKTNNNNNNHYDILPETTSVFSTKMMEEMLEQNAPLRGMLIKTPFKQLSSSSTQLYFYTIFIVAAGRNSGGCEEDDKSAVDFSVFGEEISSMSVKAGDLIGRIRGKDKTTGLSFTMVLTSSLELAVVSDEKDGDHRTIQMKESFAQMERALLDVSTLSLGGVEVKVPAKMVVGKV